MTNREAFDVCTEEQIESALRKAWGETGSCRSCNWWSAFYEVANDLWPGDDGDVNLWTTYCHSKDNPDCEGYCYIEPDFVKELEG